MGFSEILHQLVLAVAHDPRCPQAHSSQACSCGKAQVIREAHAEACRALREAGVLK